jgi:hypothetical protein
VNGVSFLLNTVFDSDSYTDRNLSIIIRAMRNDGRQAIPISEGQMLTPETL